MEDEEAQAQSLCITNVIESKDCIILFPWVWSIPIYSRSTTPRASCPHLIPNPSTLLPVLDWWLGQACGALSIWSGDKLDVVDTQHNLNRIALSKHQNLLLQSDRDDESLLQASKATW